MFLIDLYVFVDREGNKQNLMEIEFTLKVVGLIIDIIFSDIQYLVQLKWGEPISKAMAVGRKIDLQIICQGKNQGSSIILTLHGQIIGVDLLDEGLYFGFEGPILRFSTQINDITENIVCKAEALSCLNKDSDPFSNTFHTKRISKPNHHKADLIRSTYFTPTKQQKK
ncbi:6118_t:CDS:2 [Funneliformis mosseae]|uniref:6118_t:CDS:1 n=1 Tax=Funneliformis mosseae TaxID=27381 RepID=A0A9N9HP24_FUNMO|nr:6118_t:CDS:2 [Funneliformis mosseae]